MTMLKESRASRADRVFDFVNLSLLCLTLLVVAYPLLYIISASISDPNLVNQGKVWLFPRGINFDGYRRVFQDSMIWLGYRNTVFYVVLGTLINLFVTLTCAYPLSRKDFYGRNLFTVLFTFTMFFNGGLIPSYLLVKNLGMYDSIWALVIPGAASMYNIIIVRTFFDRNIPIELQESAHIDGCSNTRLFAVIVLPLSAPIIAVMSLFYGVGHWNSFFNALIYLSDRGKYPLQLVLREILVQNQMSTEMMITADDIDLIAKQARVADLIKYCVIIVSTLPIIVVYPFLQRYFVQGMLVGAIKG